MKSVRAITAISLLSVCVAASAQNPLSKIQAIDLALASHPGEATKAYEETKQGVKVWEIKINGKDSYKWEVYYRQDNGELVKEEKDD